MPSFDVGLAGATGFDGPLVGIRGDGFDGIDGRMCRCRGPSHRLGLIGLLCRSPWKLGAVKSIAGNGSRLGLLLLFRFHFQGLGLTDLVCLAQFLQDLEIENDQNPVIYQYRDRPGQ